MELLSDENIETEWRQILRDDGHGVVRVVDVEDVPPKLPHKIRPCKQSGVTIHRSASRTRITHPSGRGADSYRSTSAVFSTRS